MKKINKNFLTAYEISEYFEIPLNTIYRLSKTGKLKGIKIGKQWRYAKSDIEELLLIGASPRNLPARKNPDFFDRRQYPRINCDISCVFTKRLPNSLKTNATIKNISAGGLYIEGAVAKNDDPVELEFRMDCQNEEINIKVSGKALRVQDNGIAVKYRNIPDEIKEKIIKYVG